jgi:signal peptidase I
MFVFRSSILDWNVVPTGSMQPTIVEGDYILVDKLAYDVRMPFLGWRLAPRGEPRRGDIVVFEPPGEAERYVKRIVGVPGDVLEVRDHRVFVNGAPGGYDFPYPPPPRPARARLALPLGPRAHAAFLPGDDTTFGRFGPVQVPLGHYFVMGDNRPNSKDSRAFGFVPRDRLIGRATRVLMSLDPQAHWSPRMGRFLHELA